MRRGMRGLMAAAGLSIVFFFGGLEASAAQAPDWEALYRAEASKTAALRAYARVQSRARARLGVRLTRIRRLLGPVLAGRRMRLTAYNDGTRTFGSVAAPRWIARGTYLIIEGMGLFQVDDRGSAVRSHLDIYTPWAAEPCHGALRAYGVARPRVWTWRGPVPAAWRRLKARYELPEDARRWYHGKP